MTATCRIESFIKRQSQLYEVLKEKTPQRLKLLGCLCVCARIVHRRLVYHENRIKQLEKRRNKKGDEWLVFLNRMPEVLLTLGMTSKRFFAKRMPMMNTCIGSRLKAKAEPCRRIESRNRRHSSKRLVRMYR